MRAHNRSNALLVELLIVVMFFMLSAAVLMQVFAKARSQSMAAGQISSAIQQAQNTAEVLWAAAEPREELTAMGFAEQDGAWTLEKDGYTLTVTGQEEQTSSGVLTRHQVTAAREDEVLISLPVARYREVQP